VLHLLLLADVKGMNLREALLSECAVGALSLSPGLRKGAPSRPGGRTVARTSEIPPAVEPSKGDHMGADDKVENTTEKLAGKAKEAFGHATNDDEKVAEGRGDQSKADLKQAGENVKDAFK
jgi:uncharacterized protein YjbJ (UPF0337 family)